MRPIDADDFRERMDMICDAGGYLQPITEAVREYVKIMIDRQPTVQTALDKIDDEPIADVEVVRHGHWIRGDSKGWATRPSCLWYCSCCGEKIRYVDTLRTYQKIKKPVNEVNPYCRKCGAKMDGGDSNGNS